VIALDSSAWIEAWERPEARAKILAAIVEHGGDPSRIVVPATVVFETYRWLLRHHDDEDEIDTLAASLEQQDHVAIDHDLARRAAVTSITTGLAAADATILAAARSRHAMLLTYDADFAGIPDVVVLER
jgi:predicted nucleic acid-binding protein